MTTYRWYKIKDKNKASGTLVFESVESLAQPDYPLRFGERNLHTWLEVEQLQKRAKGGKAESMIKMAMRKSFMLKLIEAKKLESDAVLRNRTSVDSEGSLLRKILQQKDFQKMVKGNTMQASDIASFTRNRVRYYDDRKFPFELSSEIDYIVQKALEWVNHSHFDEKFGVDPALNNEFHHFLSYNRSGVNNLVIYLFWITVSILLNDINDVSFPKEFIDEVRVAMKDQFRAIYFNFILRLKR